MAVGGTGVGAGEGVGVGDRVAVGVGAGEGVRVGDGVAVGVGVVVGVGGAAQPTASSNAMAQPVTAIALSNHLIMVDSPFLL